MIFNINNHDYMIMIWEIAKPDLVFESQRIKKIKI